MPFIHLPRLWQRREIRETPESDVLAWSQISRRSLLRSVGALAVSAAAPALPAFAFQKGKEPGAEIFPAKRNEQFTLDRPITDEQKAAQYNNFYEFSTGKRIAPLVRAWDISDWKLEVTGLVDNPSTFGMDDLGRKFPYEERLYRHRCVETWGMAVPWTGFPMPLLLEHVRPQSAAKFVKFVSFDHTKAKGTRRASRTEPWPYTEGLTIAEAANDLAFIVTGMYGHPLAKQHGAPVRLVVPWKYGFKSGKSLVRIEFTATRPATFWNTLAPQEYGFLANVDPSVPHPRWSQAMEWDIGTRDRRPTLPYNGYGQWVASLYT